MRTRRQKLLEDREAILGRFNADENSLPIPTDLIYEIFFRLSPTYIARCRCVSKRWDSLLARQDFTDQFLKRSSSRPQLLFACEEDGKVSFFSSPQPQNPDENSSPVTANYHMSLPFDDVYQIHSPISGLVCVTDFRVVSGRKIPVMLCVICNPSTRQTFTLPQIKTRKKWIKSFFGYDPIEKQFKVLSMTWSRGDGNAISEEHQVLTLETGKLSWRRIECDVPHFPGCYSVCINGFLYYKAKPNISSSLDEFIICFDVRSEKFNSIKATESFTEAVNLEATLFNYKGKLAGSNFFGGTCTSFEMWVLDDPEKQEWSKHSYKLPPQWQTVVLNSVLNFVGVTGSDEIVFSESSPSKPFYVFYYSLEKKIIRKVEIQGMGESVEPSRSVHTFLNHVEDVRLMKGVLEHVH